MHRTIALRNLSSTHATKVLLGALQRLNLNTPSFQLSNQSWKFSFSDSNALSIT
jgi:hypothetical protein